MENIILNDRLASRFDRKEMLILGGTLQIEKVKQLHNVIIHEMISKVSIFCA